MNSKKYQCGFTCGFAVALGLLQAIARCHEPQVPLPLISKNVLSISDCGGVGDGLFLNTDAFAKAMSKLTAQGGGELDVPPGIWLTGPIKLQSDIDLHVERGALIQFSGDFTLYPLVAVDIKGEKEINCTSPISGENLENVAITGSGIIDGGGNAWRPVKQNKLTDGEWKSLVKSGGVLSEKGDTWWPSQAAMNGDKTAGHLFSSGSLNPQDYEAAHQSLRPKLVRFIRCKKVLLEGVTLQNPPGWTLNPQLCEDVSIINITVHNAPSAQNSDALDLESCRHAVILSSTFDAGDDGICIKSGKDEAGRRIGVPTEDVLVQDCTVYHAHGGFTIGSEMSGGVRNIRVNNCTFIGTDVGLRFKSTRGRGGVVENINISNICMTDILGDAVNLNLYYGGKSALDESANEQVAIPPVTDATPQFRDIHVSNLVCRGAQGAIVLQGLPEMPLHDITFKNVSITANKGVSVTDAQGISFDNVSVICKTGDKLKTTRVNNSKLDIQDSTLMKKSIIRLVATIGCITAGLTVSVCQADDVARAAPALPQIPNKSFIVTTFGAKSDDTTANTKAVQTAIDTAEKSGGGTVEIPAGNFLCGPIQLANNIELKIDEGATLKMLPLDQYPGGTEDPGNFISGAGLHDIAISGSGTIDGQGTPWWPFAKTNGAKRPRMIALSGCNRVLIEKVKLMNSPMFHIAIGGKTENVTVQGVTISATPSTDPDHPGHNTDACDVTGHHVLIKDCDVSVGDDNFTCGGGTSDVLITHCTYGYGHGVSIGSHTVGDISNITVEDCTFKNTESGIRIKTDRDRGGHVHDLTYRNLQMTNVGCPILIYESYMATEKKYRDLNDLTAEIAEGYPSAPKAARTPVYENISFINITATAGPGKRAGLIWGLPESPVNNLLLQNVKITADKPFGIYYAKGVRLVDTTFVTPAGEVSKPSITNAQFSVDQAP